MRHVLPSLVLVFVAVAAQGEAIAVKDTLAPAAGANPQQAEFLRQSCWRPAAFTVTVEDRKAAGPNESDARVFFPSPKPSGNAKRDRVVAHWFKARDARGELLKAPAPVVVVVHSMHPQMVDGMVLSRLLAAKGIHALMVELPGYGARNADGKGVGVEMAEHGAQAVADVRRARDAAKALPGVKQDTPVGLEGLSLGGMVAASAAGLDNAFAPVVLAASGGDPVMVVEKGGFDALWMRQRLAKAGYSGQKLRALLDPMDPLAVAGRLDRETCWVYQAAGDGVFPQTCTDRLVAGIGLQKGHVMVKPGNHYAAMLWLPEIAEFMAGKMK